MEPLEQMSDERDDARSEDHDGADCCRRQYDAKRGHSPFRSDLRVEHGYTSFHFRYYSYKIFSQTRITYKNLLV